MKEDIVKRDNSVLLSFLAGGVIGAGIALLLAPKTGREMRRELKDFAVDTKENMSAAIHQGKDLYDESKVAISSAIDAGKAAYMQEKERHIKAA